MATLSADRTEARSTLKIIDSDTHWTEPHDLWIKRAPARWRDRVPVVKMHEGVRSWVIDGDKSIGTGAHPCAAIRKDGTKVRALEEFFLLQYEDIHPAASLTKDRLALMDELGIYAHIIYPNILGFGGQETARVDPALRLACVQIYNDAAAEMQEESNGRLCAMSLLPWWDVKEAVRETERCHAMGLRGININSDPQDHNDEDGNPIPDLGTSHWDPLWEVCEALDTPINFHIGGSERTMNWIGTMGWPSLSRELSAGLGGTMAFINNGRVMSNIIYSGALDRYPKLKFVSVESGVGWVPFILEALDYQLAEIAEGVRFELKPSEYFRRNFYGTFWFETEDTAHLLRRVGIDNVMFQTDFPHPTGLYPIENLEGRLSALTREERAKVLSLNAAKLYRIDID
jgi:predicted TIM-barrel fold metal-dependent hydrolase